MIASFTLRETRKRFVVFPGRDKAAAEPVHAAQKASDGVEFF